MVASLSEQMCSSLVLYINKIHLSSLFSVSKLNYFSATLIGYTMNTILIHPSSDHCIIFLVDFSVDLSTPFHTSRIDSQSGL